MKNSKKSPKKQKEKDKKQSSGELKKPSKLAPAKIKGKGKDAKNWKDETEEDEEFDVPLDEDFKGFNDLYEEDEEDDDF